MAKKNTKEFITKLKAGVIVQYRGRVLLIREYNGRTRRYAWNVIKGTFEPQKDASILDTAVREAREEANAKIKLSHLIGIYSLLDRRSSLTMFTFAANLLNPRVGVPPRKLRVKYRKDEHIIETRFFTKQELSKLRPVDFVGMRGYLAVQDYLKGQRFRLDIIHTLPPK